MKAMPQKIKENALIGKLIDWFDWFDWFDVHIGNLGDVMKESIKIAGTFARVFLTSIDKECINKHWLRT